MERFFFELLYYEGISGEGIEEDGIGHAVVLLRNCRDLLRGCRAE